MQIADLSDGRTTRRNGVIRFTRAQISARSHVRHAERIARYNAKPEVIARQAVTRRAWQRANPEKMAAAYRRWEEKKGALGILLFRAQRGAKARGLEFAITTEDFTELPTHCPVLGIKLDYVGTPGRTPRSAEKASRASLDRKDNSKGYVVGNVFVVSFRANQLKSDGTASELRALANWMEH